jgi:transcriptional regulator with XRE-family HTH domain
MTLAERLRMARVHAKLSQPQLAERSGVSQQMISRLERGSSKGSAGIVNLAIVCGVRPEWLSDGTEPMLSDPEPIAEVMRLAWAIQSLPPNDRAHLQAVADAFAQSAQLIPWDEVTERRRGAKEGKG